VPVGQLVRGGLADVDRVEVGGGPEGEPAASRRRELDAQQAEADAVLEQRRTVELPERMRVALIALLRRAQRACPARLRLHPGDRRRRGVAGGRQLDGRQLDRDSGEPVRPGEQVAALDPTAAPVPPGRDPAQLDPVLVEPLADEHPAALVGVDLLVPGAGRPRRASLRAGVPAGRGTRAPGRVERGPAPPQLPVGLQDPLGFAGELPARFDGAPLHLVDGRAVEPHPVGEAGLGEPEGPPPSRQLGPELRQQQRAVAGRQELGGGHGRLLRGGERE